MIRWAPCPWKSSRKQADCACGVSLFLSPFLLYQVSHLGWSCLWTQTYSAAGGICQDQSQSWAANFANCTKSICWKISRTCLKYQEGPAQKHASSFMTHHVFWNPQSCYIYIPNFWFLVLVFAHANHARACLLGTESSLCQRRIWNVLGHQKPWLKVRGW